MHLNYMLNLQSHLALHRGIAFYLADGLERDPKEEV